MRAMLVALAAGALFVMPTDSFAQSGRARGSAEGRVEQRSGRTGGTARGRVDTRRRDDRYDRRDDRRDNRRYDYGRGQKKNGNGPAFCRNGRGHPVHGREWCRDKGWDYDRDWDRRDRDRRDRDRRDRDWDRVDWGDIIFGGRDRRGDRLSSNILLSLLGDRVFGRLDSHRRSRGYYNNNMDGRWVRYGNGDILQIFAGGVQIAQLIDANRDGRAETVLLNRR